MQRRGLADVAREAGRRRRFRVPAARLTALAASISLLLAAITPDAAQAHGLVGRADIPVPVWLFAWGAALVLVVSFVALAVLWPRPRLERAEAREVCPLPVAVDVVLGAVGVALFLLVVYAGLAGEQEVPTANLAPTFIYVIFWVGLVVVSLLFGDVFALLSPWRAIARAAAWVADRLAGDRLPAPLAYPGRLGRWPAAISIAAFAWLELAYVGRDRPSTLAILALSYLAVQLVAMSLFGVEPWSRRGDGFGVYFGFFARMSPWFRQDGKLMRRPLLSGVTSIEPSLGTVALLCVMIGSTTFDGASNGPLWAGGPGELGIGPTLTTDLGQLGLSPEVALQAAFTVGLVGCALVAGSLYRLGILGVRFAGGAFIGGGDAGREPTGTLALRFVHSLVPIAAAYVIAHYFSFLAYQGQAIFALASDPLGHGSNLFGTAQDPINYGLINATAIWYLQVAALLAGHLAGLVLAHDRAVALYRRSRDAARSQAWMLTVMVGFTCLALYLISAANTR